ncbi:phage holin family protein [Salinibacterium hongtaonis]|uniref:phage holin family protein n=1 Tax=Homoserinimonas hongtaonis TaxID=2079791 RepID=UPI000D332021|nr:phage holin family protein [Salinibacterium hongtaonis]AWB88390.1 hypothetical protein C2138_01455 [Salinibacterium hongtaonis]
MIRFLLHILVSLIAAAAGLLIAAWLIDGVKLTPSGFITAVVIFAIAQGVLGPWVFNLARRFASAIMGGIGLVTTLIALLVASAFSGGLSIEGFTSWALATLVVWFVTALGGWILGYFLINRRVDKKRASV